MLIINADLPGLVSRCKQLFKCVHSHMLICKSIFCKGFSSMPLLTFAFSSHLAQWFHHFHLFCPQVRFLVQGLERICLFFQYRVQMNPCAYFQGILKYLSTPVTHLLPVYCSLNSAHPCSFLILLDMWNHCSSSTIPLWKCFSGLPWWSRG